MSIDQLRLILLSFILCLVNAKAEVIHERCPRFHIKKTTIIKTQQSIRDGAEFLGKKVVSSSRGCHENCCKTEGCNLVMLKYEVKENAHKVSCFMFNCRSPSVCTFLHHSTYHGYAALEYEERKFSFSHKNNDFKADHEVKATTTETPQPTTVTTTKVNNWGNIKWFEADTTTKPPKYVKPKYNSESSGKNVVDQDAEVDKLSTTHHSYNTADTKHNSWLNSAPKNSEHQGTTEFGTYDHAKKMNTDTAKNQAATEAPDEDEDFARRVFVDNNPDFPDEPGSHHEKPQHDAEKPTKAKPKTTHLRTTRAATKTPVTRYQVRNDVIRRISVQENKAVIPLAVCLVLALLLLMGVIFRLKTSRRRRTKAFLTDDADYLINGMYL